MLYIEKKRPSQATLRELTRVKSSPVWTSIPVSDTKALRAQFDSLDKATIRADLLIEQRYLCAYCMKRIENDGKRTRIDHKVPLSISKDEALSYKNFLAVCDGGSKSSAIGKRILCCDASKEDNEKLTIDPTNTHMMSCIWYSKDGVIGFRDDGTYDKETVLKINQDIELTLRLNGIKSKDGIRDTSTQIVKGRKDAYKRADAIIRTLIKKKHLTSANVANEIRRIENAEQREEFAGVLLFCLKKKYRSLLAQGI